MNYVVNGVMIGGFGLVASPAEYTVTGVRTFIVSNDGVVYERDAGPKSLDEFKAMERFNPDKSWTPVLEDEDKLEQKEIPAPQSTTENTPNQNDATD